MDVWSAIILGLIQGATEFIPVSSTAHLILAPQFLNIATPTNPHAFDTIIQAGTLLPVLVYFRSDWLNLLRGVARAIARRRVAGDPGERMAVLVLIATLPAFFFGALLNRQIESLARIDERLIGFLVIGIALIAVGILMWWVDALALKRRSEAQLTAVDALVIGLAQAVALLPGVSRSAATLTAGLVTGLTREAAARFSFLIATPALAGAVAYKLLKLQGEGGGMPAPEWVALGCGLVAAAVSGYACIAFLLAYLRRNSLAAFAYYRVVLGLFLIGLYVAQTRGQ